MIPLPKYIKNLRWGSQLFFLRGLNLCVHTKNNSFTLTRISTGESIKFNVKNTYKFFECVNTNRLFFSSYTHYYKNKIYFYVLDLNSNSLERTVAKLNTEVMSVFLSDDETTATVIHSNGSIVTVDIDRLTAEEVMNLQLSQKLSVFYFINGGSLTKPWYRTQPGVYETVVRGGEKGGSSFAKLSIDNKRLELNFIRQVPFNNSVYLEEVGIWVHTTRNKFLSFEEEMSKLHPLIFEMRRNGEIFWKFEILCKLVHEETMFWKETNIVSLSRDTFVICLSNQICLCDVKNLTAKVISFAARFADVFFDTAKGRILPVYYSGVTKDMYTMDDFDTECECEVVNFTRAPRK